MVAALEEPNLFLIKTTCRIFLKLQPLKMSLLLLTWKNIELYLLDISRINHTSITKKSNTNKDDNIHKSEALKR